MSMRSIGFFPAVTDEQAQYDLLARATWYVWPWRDRVSAIRMWGLPAPDAVDPARVGLDPSIAAQYADIRPRLLTTPGNDEDAAAALVAEPSDLLFIWRAPRSDHERTLADRVEAACRASGGVVKEVDPQTAMNEGSLYLWGCLQALGDEPARIEECRLKFDALRARVRHPSVHIFGTGPSLSLLKEHDFSGADSIVCNSIVANDALLDRTNPIAIVAGDPIFHAGCSQYAADFRTKLRHVLETRDIFFVTVMRDYVQQLAQLPEHLHHKVIAIPFAPDRAPFHFHLEKSFHIAPEGNVLSLLLFPLAAALYERITVSGCDGRPLSENAYFWGHDKASQLSTERMSNIQRVHPAFFVRSYDDHYSAHVSDVTRIVNVLEEAGKRIDVLTPSYIPVLAARQCTETRALSPLATPSRRTLLVSVNPDATDDYGHWVWYDRRLSEQAKQRDAGFLSLANVKLRRDIQEREGHFRAVFEYETWGAGNQKMDDIDFTRLVEFEATLGSQASALREEFPDHARVFYLYTGSLPHALAMYRVARQHPQDYFVINTFWTCVMDCQAENYMARWGEFLREAEDMVNLRIFSITRQLKTIFRQDAGVDLPLLPHPTPSLSKPAPPPRTEQPFRVLFPGGMTEQKGFQDVPDILARIRSASLLDDAELVVRATETDGVMGDERAAILNDIRINAEFVNEVMDDSAFLNWLARADVAVLPYRHEQWVYRNSALLVDLLYLGVPVVCARGTWLSDVIDELGGGLTVDGDDPDAYAHAVETIRLHRDEYARAAVNAANRYDAANSWTALADSVLAILQDPAAHTAPPEHACADEAAPINWWRPANEPEDQPVSESPKPPRAVFAERPAGPREALVFLFTYLTRSPIVVAFWTFAIVCIILSTSQAAFLQPIKTQLAALSIAALAGAGGWILARYLHAHRKGLAVRIARRAAVADLAAGIGSAILSPGILRKVLASLFVLLAGAWVVTYAMRLNGTGSQFALDLAFWGGAGLFASVAILGVGLRAVAHTARRFMMRNTERLLAAAKADAAERIGASEAKFDAVTTANAAQIAQLLEQIVLTNRRLTAAAAGLKATDERLTHVHEALSGQIDEKLGAITAGVETLGHSLTSMSNVVQNVAMGVEQINQTQAAHTNVVDTAIGEVSARVSNLNRLTDEIFQNASSLSTRVANVENGADNLERRSIVMRDTLDAIESSGFHVVQRHMPHDDLDRLAKDLSRAFDIDVTGPLLGYAASRVRDLESRSLGRIAAPMSDILVRIATLMAVKRKEASVLEIGTLFGLGALAMRDVCRHRFERTSLTFLDPLSGYYGGEYGPALIDVWSGVPVTRETLEENIRIAGVPDQDARILQFYSENPDALAQASSERYDVLIIDGDHSFDGVMRDYTDYAPLVRKNGFVIFDDYEVPEWSGVTDAVNSILEDTPALQRVILDGKTLVCRVRGTLAEARPRHPPAAVDKQSDAL